MRFHPVIFCFLLTSALGSVPSRPALAIDAYVKSALDAPEIGIALGDLIYGVEFKGADPRLPLRANQLDETSLLPIDPAALVIQFPKAQVSKGDDDWRLILTEHGQWGYAAVKRGADRRIIAQADIEAMLKDYRQSRRSWVFLKDRVLLENGAIALTLGELYPLETTGGTSVLVDKNLTITRSKYDQIKAIGYVPKGVTEVTDGFLIPLSGEYRKAIGFIDLKKAADLYKEPMESVGGFASRGQSEPARRARLAMVSNTKFLATGTGSRLECNVVRKYQTDAISKKEWSAGVNADIGKFLSAFTAGLGDLGFSANVSAGASSSLEQKISTTATDAAMSFDYDIHIIDQPGEATWALIGNSQSCVKNPSDDTLLVESGSRYFRVVVPDIAGTLVDEAMYKQITQALPNIEWNTTTGKLRVKCRIRDYEPLLEYFKTELDLSDSAARLALQKLVSVVKKDFESC